MAFSGYLAFSGYVTLEATANSSNNEAVRFTQPQVKLSNFCRQYTCLLSASLLYFMCPLIAINCVHELMVFLCGAQYRCITSVPSNRGLRYCTQAPDESNQIAGISDWDSAPYISLPASNLTHLSCFFE